MTVKPLYHTLTITTEGLEIAMLKDLIANVESDLATLKAELVQREADIEANKITAKYPVQ